jgi:hypothetical protein
VLNNFKCLTILKTLSAVGNSGSKTFAQSATALSRPIEVNLEQSKKTLFFGDAQKTFTNKKENIRPQPPTCS